MKSERNKEGKDGCDLFKIIAQNKLYQTEIIQAEHQNNNK